MAKFKLSGTTQRAIASEGRAYLAERFPQTFAGKGDEKRPLKIGIDKDLIAAGVPGFVACRALSDYTGGPTYRRNLVEGADRIDLDGQPSGRVSAEDAARAAQRLSLQLARAA